MNLLDLYVKISAKDEASAEVEKTSSGIISKLGNAGKVAAKAMMAVGAATVAAVGAVGAASVAIGKQALDSYADYEQLTGGIQKLYGNAGMSVEEYAKSVGKSVDEAQGDWERNERAQQIMMDNANAAYKTAGMSANQYMESATQFSAALVNSLGGDTEKAAKLTDVAMRAISDNVNTFGSDAEAATNAVIGLSRGNYTMIDNLKLGFAGTAEGMMKLINQSGVLGYELTKTSELADVGFDKMIEAIQAVQEQQGIAGTTAREASETISGSIASTQAAWSNLLTSLAGGGQDVGTALTAVMESAQDVVRNVTPVAARIVSTFVTEIPQHLPEMIETFMSFLTTSFEDGEGNAQPSIIDSLKTLLQSIVSYVVNGIPDLAAKAYDLFMSFVQSASEAMPGIIAALALILQDLVRKVVDNVPTLLHAGIELFTSLVESLINVAPLLLATLAEAVFRLIWRIPEFIPDLAGAAGRLFGALLAALVNLVPVIGQTLYSLVVSLPYLVMQGIAGLFSAGLALIGGIIQGVTNAFPGLSRQFGDMPNRLVRALGNISRAFVNVGVDAMAGFANGIWKGIRWVTDAAAGVARNALNAAKSWLGISSPSKEFRKVGGFTMEGFAEGIEDTAGMVEKAMRNATEGVYGAASGGIDVNAIPTQFQTGAASSKSGPHMEVNIREMVVRDPNDAEMFAEMLNDYWLRSVEGQLG